MLITISLLEPMEDLRKSIYADLITGLKVIYRQIKIIYLELSIQVAMKASKENWVIDRDNPQPNYRPLHSATLNNLQL